MIVSGKLSDGRWQEWNVTSPYSLFTRFQTSINGTWSNWMPFPSPPGGVNSIAVENTADGRLLLNATNTSNQRWACWKATADANSGWTAWVLFAINFVLYQDIAFEGRPYTVTDFSSSVRYVKDLSADGFNDQASSYKVFYGYVALWVDANFNNSVYKIGPGEENADMRQIGWNDVVSSYIAMPHDFDPAEAAQQYR